jgi:hypothetical protein
VRVGNPGTEQAFIATIEAMRGTVVAVYTGKDFKDRIVLDEQLKEGHAIATGDLFGLGRNQVVAGWRVPNTTYKSAIKLYIPVIKYPPNGIHSGLMKMA